MVGLLEINPAGVPVLTPSILQRRRSSVPKTVKVNPVDYLVFRNFSNKYCFGVYAIEDIQNKSGHSPVVLRFLLSSLIGSKAVRGSTADQITQALCATNSTDGTTERRQLVDTALNEWSTLSTAGLSDVAADLIEEKRLCRFELATFVHNTSTPFKSQFLWLLRKRMGSLWNEITPNNPDAMEEWAKTFSKRPISDMLPKSPNTMLTVAAAFNIKMKWSQPLESLRVPLQPFEITPVDKIYLPMFKVNSKVVYHKDIERGFHLVGIPFKDRRFIIAFLLPLIAHQYKEVETRFTEGLNYNILIHHSHLVPMNVVIPSFQVETSVDLFKTLGFLGMRDPLDSARADFSGICDAQNLHLESGTESSMLQVYKNGIRFQSVAAINLSTARHTFKLPEVSEKPELRWQEPKAEEVTSFVVNQPFGVILIDRESESILYNGKVKIARPVNANDYVSGPFLFP